MKVAVVGFGTAGSGRLSGYRSVPDAEVVAIVEPSRTGREDAAVALPDGWVVASLSELFGLIDASTDIDLVDVCTPPAFHGSLTREALAAGCHVVCEKPVAASTAEALELTREAAAVGRLLYPAHNYATSPLMESLRGAVGGGGIGSLQSALFRIRRDRHARGTDGFRPDWRRSADLAGGGILLDHGTHCVYMALRLFGGVPEKVSCTLSRPDGDPRAVEDEVALDLHFGDANCRIELSWRSNERSNHYGLTGTCGGLDIDDGRVRGYNADGRWERDLSSPSRDQKHLDWFPAMYGDLRATLEDPRRWGGPAAEIVDTARVLETAYRSAEADGRVMTP